MPSPGGSPASQAHGNGAAPMVRVLIVNESRIACQSLKESLERSCRRVRVTGCATTGTEATALLRAGNVDVALVNDDIQEGAAFLQQFLCEIHREFNETKLIVLLRLADAPSVLGAFRGGARAVFHRSETIEALCKCIRVVHAGQIWASNEDLQHVIATLEIRDRPSPAEPPDIALLTKRENDAARLVAEGHTNRSIADKLGLTEHTVSNYLFRIYNKLGISSRVELVLYAFNQKRES